MGFLIQKSGKFWSISDDDDVIKHKALILEECKPETFESLSFSDTNRNGMKSWVAKLKESGGRIWHFCIWQTTKS